MDSFANREDIVLVEDQRLKKKEPFAADVKKHDRSPKVASLKVHTDFTSTQLTNLMHNESVVTLATGEESQSSLQVDSSAGKVKFEKMPQLKVSQITSNEREIEQLASKLP